MDASNDRKTGSVCAVSCSRMDVDEKVGECDEHWKASALLAGIVIGVTVGVRGAA